MTLVFAITEDIFFFFFFFEMEVDSSEGLKASPCVIKQMEHVLARTTSGFSCQPGRSGIDSIVWIAFMQAYCLVLLTLLLYGIVCGSYI